MINSIIKRIKIEKCDRRASVLLKFHRHGCSFRERWGEVHFHSVVGQALSADPEPVWNGCKMGTEQFIGHSLRSAQRVFSFAKIECIQRYLKFIDYFENHFTIYRNRVAFLRFLSSLIECFRFVIY
jgi:hypothetical protein